MGSNALLFYSFSMAFLTNSFTFADDDHKSISSYLEKFSHINIIEILSNDRLFSAYFKCFMETGPCTPDAREMRDIIPTVAKTACEMCTDEQKKEIKKHLDYIKQNRPKEWDDLIEKFDPKKENLEKFLATISE